MEQHQYGIFALVSQMSFCGHTSGGITEVRCFLRLPNCLFMLGLFVFHLRPHAILFPLLSHFSQWFSPERKERKILLRASCGLKYKLKISITKGLLKLEVLGKVPRVSFTDAGMSLVSQASTCRWSDFSMTLKWKCTNKTETTNKEK